ncbi:Polysaccharide biosynthesis protein [compost metagenome]
MNRSKILGFMIGPIGSAILGFATLPIMAWFFSAEDIGRISMLQLACSFAVILFSLGMDQSFVREYHETDKKPALLKNAATPGLLLLAATLLSLTIYDPDLISKVLFSVDNSTASFLTITCLITAYISRFLSLILRMQEKGLAFSMSQLLPKILFLALIGTYTLINIELNFNKLIIAHSISILAVMFFYSWNTKKDWTPAISEHLDKSRIIPMVKFGLPLIAGGLASWAMMATDKILLRSLSSFEELGIYSIATSIAMAAGVLSGIFTTIWAPTVFKWASEGINTENIDKISEHVLAVVILIFILTGLFAWTLPYFLPRSYAPVQYLVTSCIAAPLLYALSEATSIGISITRKTAYAMIASILAATLNFIASYWMIPKYGALGASASTALAFWFFLICRTELSCLAWRKVPRIKLYSTTSICLIVSISVAFLGEKYKITGLFVWAILVGLWAITFKASINSLNFYIKNGNKSQST